LTRGIHFLKATKNTSKKLWKSCSKSVRDFRNLIIYFSYVLIRRIWY
jgi:hypothetical protein